MDQTILFVTTGKAPMFFVSKILRTVFEETRCSLEVWKVKEHNLELALT